jgi:hypothetical protein
MSEWIRKLTDKYSEVNENKKAALLKKLAKTAQSSAKGKAAVTLPKAPFKIPEEIAATERTAFMGAAAAAHKSGKSHFNFAGKKHKVTMQKDTAKAIADDVEEAKIDEISMDKATRTYAARKSQAQAAAHQGSMDYAKKQMAKARKTKAYMDKREAVEEATMDTAAGRKQASAEADAHHKAMVKKWGANHSATKDAANAAKVMKKKAMESANEIDEISMTKLSKYSKAAAKDIDQKRNKVKAALDQPASVKHAKAGMKAMQGLTKRSKGSDMYVNKMTGRSKVKPTAEAYENIPKATHKGVQDPMGKGLSPSAKDQLAKKMPTPEPIDEPKVDAKNFKTFRKGLKQAKKRPGDK